MNVEDATEAHRLLSVPCLHAQSSEGQELCLNVGNGRLGTRHMHNPQPSTPIDFYLRFNIAFCVKGCAVGNKFAQSESLRTIPAQLPTPTLRNHSIIANRSAHPPAQHAILLNLQYTCTTRTRYPVPSLCQVLGGVSSCKK